MGLDKLRQNSSLGLHAKLCNYIDNENKTLSFTNDNKPGQMRYCFGKHFTDLITAKKEEGKSAETFFGHT